MATAIVLVMQVVWRSAVLQSLTAVKTLTIVTKSTTVRFSCDFSTFKMHSQLSLISALRIRPAAITAVSATRQPIRQPSAFAMHSTAATRAPTQLRLTVMLHERFAYEQIIKHLCTLSGTVSQRRLVRTRRRRVSLHLSTVLQWHTV